MGLRLADLAVRYGCEVHGSPDTEVNRVGTLHEAVQGSISFLANPAYHKHLATTTASAVILTEQFVKECPVDCLVATDPYLVYARIAAELHPLQPLTAGVHPAAIVAAETRIPASCEIAAGAVIGRNVQLGEYVHIGSNVVIGDDVTIGSDSRLSPNVTLYNGVTIGERCLLHSGVVIGADGFGIAKSDQGWVKVPQVGNVLLGHDVEVGANTTIDCGAIGDTLIGNGVKLDNQVQIGHNVKVGAHTVMASQAGIAGSTTVGTRCVLGGKVAVAGHLEIADDVYLLARASVSKSILKPGMYSSVLTVEEAGKWRRIAGRIKRLDEMGRRLAALEKTVKKVTAKDT